MEFQSTGWRAFLLPLAVFLAVSACSESNRPVPYSDVEFGPLPPPEIPPQDNENIDNPTLTLADNDEVSPGDALTLVWSDEFDAAQLDPEVWFFRNR